jgi:hypothetical protein
MISTRVRTAPLLLILISGCYAIAAYGTRTINLDSYNYGDRVTTRVAPENSRGSIAVAQLRDARPEDEREVVGKVRDAFGMPTASVVPLQDPVLWVSEGMAVALEKRGYHVDRIKTAQEAKGKPVITGAVTKVYSDVYVRIQGDIVADVEVSRSGTKIASTRCSGTAIKNATPAKSAFEYLQILKEALDAFITDCVPRLVEPLDNTLSQQR